MLRRITIVFAALCLFLMMAQDSAAITAAPDTNEAPRVHGHAKQDSIKNRAPVNHKRIKRQRELQREKERYDRRVKEVGRIPTGTFRKGIPGWWSPILLRYRGMMLSKPALEAYYEACEKAGHYIGGAGYRTHAAQASASSGLAAAPGYSYHEIGLALDVFGLSAKEKRALLSVGFHQLNGEPWHYSYRVYG